MFQEALQFKDVIIFCYSRQNSFRISGRVPPLFTWHISKIIMDFLSFVVTTCVLKQSKSHWLFYDALQFAIIMCLKLKEEIINPFVLVILIDDDFGIAFELYLFVSNIKKEVCGVLDFFF
jgi:hypothetical protein